jgi:CRISPR-associated protein Csh1
VLSQALEVFKKEYDKIGDDYILDNYIPADGTYVVVKPSDDDYVIDEVINIKLDKKTRTIDRAQTKYMNFICLADYYSKVTDMNKAILSGKGKVVQGNNYLSFIIKKESLTNGKLTKEIIDNYYNILENPRLKYSGKSNALALYGLAEEKVGQINSVRLNKIRTWIKSNLFELFKEYTGKDYLKIFFYHKDDYKKESERYLIPNIYNRNDYNQEITNIIYGLPNNNMGLNSKKPYLENKTRKITVPYLVNQEEVIYQKKFFDYLMNQASSGKFNIYIGKEIIALDNKSALEENFNGMFLRVRKDKEVVIQDYGIISNYNSKLSNEFEYKNVLRMDDEKLKSTYYGNVKTLSKMCEIINDVFFNKFLITNFFTDPKDLPKNDSILKSNLLKCRTALFNWFYKGNCKNIWMLLNNISLSLIKGSISNGYMIKAADQFNLRLSLKKYFKGGEDMADVIINTKNDLRNKISQKKTSFLENDKQYFFAVGQLVSYFISRSKGKKKPLSLANPFINAKNDKMIKDKLKALYKKYNYDIDNCMYKFKGLFTMTMSYELDNDNIDQDLIIAGYLHSNLLYEKEENVEEVESGE